MAVNHTISSRLEEGVARYPLREPSAACHLAVATVRENLRRKLSPPISSAEENNRGWKEERSLGGFTEEKDHPSRRREEDLEDSVVCG